jgi:hypothetical protein
VRSGFRARARCCACRCTGGHDVVNEHNFLVGDRGVGNESILYIGEPGFFVQSMLGRPVASIFQTGSDDSGLDPL